MTSQEHATEHMDDMPDGQAAQADMSGMYPESLHERIQESCCAMNDEKCQCDCEGHAEASACGKEDNYSPETQTEECCCCSCDCESAEGLETTDSETTDDPDDDTDDADRDESTQEDSYTLLGKAKQEAMEYLEALQRERADFMNYRNRVQKEQVRFREHGIIDVLTALLPALDDIDRIREHGQMDESFQAVSAKIDKVFERFDVHKFGKKGEAFDPTRHDAILHKPDPQAAGETVDTVVEAGYRIGGRVVRAARVVVASPAQ